MAERLPHGGKEVVASAEQRRVLDAMLKDILDQPASGRLWVPGRELRFALDDLGRERADAVIRACVPNLITVNQTVNKAGDAYLFGLDGLLSTSDPRPGIILSAMLGVLAARYREPGGRRQRSFMWSDVRRAGTFSAVDFDIAYLVFITAQLGDGGRPPQGASHDQGAPTYDYEFWIREHDLEAMVNHANASRWAELQRERRTPALADRTPEPARVVSPHSQTTNPRAPMPAVAAVSKAPELGLAAGSVMMADEDVEHTAAVLIERGCKLQDRERYSEAADLFIEAFNKARSEGDRARASLASVRNEINRGALQVADQYLQQAAAHLGEDPALRAEHAILTATRDRIRQKKPDRAPLEAIAADTRNPLDARLRGDLAFELGALDVVDEKWVAALRRFKNACSSYVEARRPLAVGKAELALAQTYLAMGQLEDASRHVDTALSHYTEYRRGRSEALAVRAKLLHRQGMAEDSLKVASEAAELAVAAGPKAQALLDVAHTALELEDLPRAETSAMAGLELFRRERMSLGEAHCLSVIGVIASARERLDEAIKRLDEAIEKYKQLSTVDATRCQFHAAACELDRNDVAAARRRVDAAGESVLPTEQLERLQQLVRARLDIAEHHETDGRATLAELASGTSEPHQVNALLELAKLSLAAGKFDEMLADALKAQAIASRLGGDLRAARTAEVIAKALVGLKRLDEANTYFAKARTEYTKLGNTVGAARCASANTAPSPPTPGSAAPALGPEPDKQPGASKVLSSILQAAVVAVPSMKYAVAVGGLAAIVSLVIVGLGLDAKTAIIGSIVVVGFMVVMVVFAQLAANGPGFKILATILAWVFSLLTVGSACLLASCFFFDRPKTIPCLLDNRCAPEPRLNAPPPINVGPMDTRPIDVPPPPPLDAPTLTDSALADAAIPDATSARSTPDATPAHPISGSASARSTKATTSPDASLDMSCGLQCSDCKIVNKKPTCISCARSVSDILGGDLILEKKDMDNDLDDLAKKDAVPSVTCTNMRPNANVSVTASGLFGVGYPDKLNAGWDTWIQYGLVVQHQFDIASTPPTFKGAFISIPMSKSARTDKNGDITAIVRWVHCQYFIESKNPHQILDCFIRFRPNFRILIEDIELKNKLQSIESQKKSHG
jgi:tetratricopeptide (TPR) repeat protein